MAAQRLYLAQHGLALEKHEDAERPLSDTGKNHSLLMAEHLNRTQPEIKQILHSGKTRAAQTADIFESCLQTGAVISCEQLSPTADAEQIIPALETVNTLVIGHLPHLGRLLSYLVSGEKQLNIVRFENSAVLKLERAKQTYQLCWYLTPDLLQAKNLPQQKYYT